MVRRNRPPRGRRTRPPRPGGGRGGRPNPGGGGRRVRPPRRNPDPKPQAKRKVFQPNKALTNTRPPPLGATR